MGRSSSGASGLFLGGFCTVLDIEKKKRMMGIVKSKQRSNSDPFLILTDCTYVKGDSAHEYSGSRCFCYSPGTVIKWKDIWSTFKVILHPAVILFTLNVVFFNLNFL